MFGAIPIYGLYYYYEQRVVAMPLLNVSAQASIKELAAQVKLTQTYGNDRTFPIEATYSFPIPARAAVCSFVMIKQDGTRVVGSVLEKQEARETYNTALSQGQQASLMEQQTPDVFKVSVGNIPANQQVQIELVYATELAEDEESDSIRFHLPVHIGARYGQGPHSTPFALGSSLFISSSSPTPFLNIALSVESIAPISKIGCPSHSVSTELGPDPKLPNFKELPFSNYARVSLSSDSALDKDFVLTIKSAGLDAPRCVAELHPTDDSVAMGLTLVPRFKLPDLSRQEFVFLVDRSGSMGGKRIDAARKALIVMLRALPHQDSLFQIVSFGSRCSALWEAGSRPYNQETLEHATRHIDGMRADYGGTEIRAALQHCFRARKLDRPLSVLVLTDGDAWDLDGVLAEVKDAVKAAPEKAFVRVSVLGIGNSASTAMCEGIARLGNGTCQMVGEEETSFTGKIARMLKAARTPPISNISVDWGSRSTKEKEKQVASQPDDGFELVEKIQEKKKTLNIFDDSEDSPMDIDNAPPPPPPQVVLPPPPVIQQAPYVVRNLFPNIRLNIYAILQGKAVPKTVTIRGSTADGAEIELPISVTLSHLQNAPGAPPAIHALSARKLIQDLEDGQHALAKTLANPDDTDLLARTVKASIIRFGKTYSISSSHTSFVAVDESKPDLPPVSAAVYLMARPAVQSQSLFGRGIGGGGPPRVHAQYAMAAPAAPNPYTPSATLFGAPATGGFGGMGMGMGASSSGSAPAANPFGSSSSFGFAAPQQQQQQQQQGAVNSYSAAPPRWQSAATVDLLSFDATSHYAPSISAQPTGYSAFGSAAPGSAAPPSGLFGSAAPSVFGSAPPSKPQTAGLFGGGGGGPATGFGRAGSAAPRKMAAAPSSHSSSPSGLFGGAAPTLAASGSSPFGAGAAWGSTPARASNTFGAAAAADPLEALARLQSFDGCFSLEVLSVIKLNTDIQSVRNVLPAGVPDNLIASLIAMAFLSTKLGAGVDRDSWEGIHDKAQQYVEAALQGVGVGEAVDVLEGKVARLLL